LLLLPVPSGCRALLTAAAIAVATFGLLLPIDRTAAMPPPAAATAALAGGTAVAFVRYGG
jgi:hypothetical protein